MSLTQTQYAIKKRKRPQPRPKNDAPAAVVKSNPSKRHRDRLNTELEKLSQLIPLPQDVVNKLDKLSILRLSVAYLRNKSYSQHMELEAKSEANALLPVNTNRPQPTTELSESELAMQALDGFIIVVTQDFNVFYITSSVQGCLGFPQSDVIYQSMLELIHTEDRKVFMKQMLLNPMGPGAEKAPEDGDPAEAPDYIKHGLSPDVVAQLSGDGHLHRSFICRLRCLHDTSSGFLALHFTGHLGLVPGQNRREKDGSQLPPELGLFLLASPLQTPSILEIRTKNYIFRTRHKLDYTPLGIDQKGRIVLGYTEQELRQQSGYQFIHSADMMHCADAHTKLMRHGQSGLTVFRLLHRANRWQWVTASARLIFNKGVPDYIISTHRPITEQEGEEHLKKRSHAFRFDFTGHASLYASVNPIGADPSSSKGPAEPAPHMTKRPRIGGEEVDPATLYGAQSFQSMNNYPDGLPNIAPRHVPGHNAVKAEERFRDVGYFDSSPGSHNSPFSSHSPQNPRSNPSTTSDSGYSEDCQPSPAFNRILEDLLEVEDAQAPPLYHPPISNPSQYEIAPGCQKSVQPGNGVRSAWSEDPNFHSDPQQQPWRQQAPAANGRIPRNHDTQLRNGYPVAHNQQPGMAQQTAYNHNYPPQRPEQFHQDRRAQYHANLAPRYPEQRSLPPAIQDGSRFPTGSATHKFMEQIHRSEYQNEHRHPDMSLTAQPKQNVSLLNSVEISSRVTQAASVQEHKELEEIVAMLGPDPATVAKDKFEISLECEEHTVQFDLHKIASEFQTANPMGVIQDYVHQNPAQAIALATGNMPETRIPGGNGLSNQVPYQTNQQAPYPSQHATTNAPYFQQKTPYDVVKSEQSAGDVDFDLEEFLRFDIPNIET